MKSSLQLVLALVVMTFSVKASALLITATPVNASIFENSPNTQVIISLDSLQADTLFLLTQVDAGSTATFGFDYVLDPSAAATYPSYILIIPAGQKEISFDIDPIDDGIGELTETIIFNFVDLNSTGQLPKFTLPDPVSISIRDNDGAIPVPGVALLLCIGLFALLASRTTHGRTPGDKRV